MKTELTHSPDQQELFRTPASQAFARNKVTDNPDDFFIDIIF
jgi:hypothetical protein